MINKMQNETKEYITKFISFIIINKSKTNLKTNPKAKTSISIIKNKFILTKATIIGN